MRRSIPALLSISVAASCGPEPPRVIVKPSEFVGDRWDQIPPTPEWKLLTRGVAEDDRSEICKTVVRALEVEMACHSVLCTPARDMADEWLLRCPPQTPELETQVEDMRETFIRRFSEPPTECAQRAALLLRDGCGGDEQCLPTVQRWMTQCRVSDATPLVITKLEQAVMREVGTSEVEIDTRSCDELKVEFDKAAKCVHKLRCDEAIGRAEAYVERCLPERRPPPASIALTWLTAIAGAQRTVAPIPLAEAKIDKSTHPLAFADGRGAALRVCEERVDDIGEYLDAREACVGGTMRFARVFEGDGARRLHLGMLAIPDDEIFRERFPTLLLASEVEAREDRALPAMVERLGSILQEAQSGRKSEAMKALVELIGDHADLLARKGGQGSRLWPALAERDAALAPLFEELGRSKTQLLGRGAIAPDKLLGFARRALERPLADLRWDGVLEVGAPSPAARVDLSRLPASLSRYQESVQEAKRFLAEVKVAKADQERSAAEAKSKAEACGAAERAREKSEADLIACGFGVASCDAARVDGLASQNDDARRTLQRSRHELELLLSGPAHGATKDIMLAADAAGCPRLP